MRGAGASIPDATPPGRAPSPFTRLVRVPRTGSTNADLVAALRRGDPRDGPWPHLGVLVTDHQAAGRGRAGRAWVTPPGTALTASVVLRPSAPPDRWTWLSLLAGLAVARAIHARTGLSAALKWPNDVVLTEAAPSTEPGWGRDRKVAGVLAEVVDLPEGPAAVVGFGVNVHQGATGLPVPWAASLASAGVAESDRDIPALLDAVGRELGYLDAAWTAYGGDAVASGLAAAVAQACSTVGRVVRVRLPGGGEVVGRATGLAGDGALVVRPEGGPAVLVTAGDVDHIRVRSD